MTTTRTIVSAAWSATILMVIHVGSMQQSPDVASLILQRYVASRNGRNMSTTGVKGVLLPGKVVKLLLGQSVQGRRALSRKDLSGGRTTASRLHGIKLRIARGNLLAICGVLCVLESNADAALVIIHTSSQAQSTFHRLTCNDAHGEVYCQ